MINSWSQVVQLAREALEELNLDDDRKKLYSDRLEFELNEINKQGANTYWVGLVSANKKFASNPNSLILPWLFGMVSDDPILNRKDPMLCSIRAADVKEYLDKYSNIPSDIIKDQDMPDIDLDCLPEARDPIKTYAMEKYGAGLNDDGYGPICSVGTWQTYKFKSAIMDVSKALEAVDQA